MDSRGAPSAIIQKNGRDGRVPAWALFIPSLLRFIRITLLRIDLNGSLRVRDMQDR
jgi:hypothetical protein